MIEEVLRKRGYKVEQDGKGLFVTVPQGKRFESAVDEIDALAQKHEYKRTVSITREVNWKW